MQLVHGRDLPFLGLVVASIALRVAPRKWRLLWRQAAGRLLGLLWCKLDRGGAALATKNIERLLGDRLSARQLKAAVAGLFQSVACSKLINDLLPVITLAELDRLLTFEGAEHLEKALSLNRGVVLLGAHFGLHTYIPLMYLRQKGYDVTAVLGEEINRDDSWLYRWIVHPIRRRPRRMMPVLSPTGQPQWGIANCLRQNGILLVLGDVLDDDMRDLPAPHVLAAPLLGHRLPLKTGPFRLARWLGAPVITFWTIAHGAGFTLVIDEPLQLNHAESTQALRDDLAAFTARFEPKLLKNPGHWAHWRHKHLLDLIKRPASDTAAIT